jgi:hypothetical protein
VVGTCFTRVKIVDLDSTTYQTEENYLYYKFMSDQLNPSTPTQDTTATANAPVFAAAPSVSRTMPGATAQPVSQPIKNAFIPPTRRMRFLPKTWQKVLFGVGVALVLLLTVSAVLGLYTYGVVQDIKAQASEIQGLGRTTYDSFKAQNLPATEEGIKQITEKTKNLRTTYNKLAFYKMVPIARNYYLDGEHGLNAADAGLAAGLKSVGAITPYADVLGFKGQGTFTGGTAEDRLKLILQTLEKVNPVLTDVSKDLETVKSELSQIDEKRYPETFQGKPVRQYITQAHEVSGGAYTLLTQFRPALEQLPDIAGGNGKRKKYFILFENDNELRPTGGFLTAYSIIYVENGKVAPDKSDDIYALDKKFKKQIPIPPILGKYLTTEKKWNLRDMNTSPDFKVSMDQFLENYKNVPDEPKDIDGIIAIDTQVLVDLLRVLGPIDVPGYGTFSAENDPKCDCPQIIHALSEIITRPTPYIREDRKGILGPMMRALLTKAYTAPKQQWPQLFEIGWSNLQGRHAQMYFFDPKSQEAAEIIGGAGRLKQDPQAKDFIAVIDANLGGAKSNLFINYDIKQEVSSPSNGQINKKVTITYKNNHRGDNCNLEAGLLCLNSTLRDWNRIYLPKGSKLVNAQGYRNGTANQYDEGDFTVIEGEFTLDPLSQAKLQIEYTVPYTDTKNYSVQVWKQAGSHSIPLVFDVNGNEDQATMDKDVLYQTKF